MSKKLLKKVPGAFVLPKIEPIILYELLLWSHWELPVHFKAKVQYISIVHDAHSGIYEHLFHICLIIQIRIRMGSNGMLACLQTQISYSLNEYAKNSCDTVYFHTMDSQYPHLSFHLLLIHFSIVTIGGPLENKLHPTNSLFCF